MSISFEPELEQLRPLLGDRVTDVLLGRERRDVFSIYPELRILSWAGVMLLATAAGIVLKNNLERIGPIALAAFIGIAAAACYAWAWWRRERASLVDDYVLLLGALLVSADVAFIEANFHLLGDDWQRHFLVLAIVHGIVAYRFNSRMVLSLSVSAFVTWIGVEQRAVFGFVRNAGIALVCAALLLIWRAIDVRVRRAHDFAPLFEHFAANLALSAGIVLAFESDSRLVGCLITLGVAAIVIAWGVRTRRESFVLYAFVYAIVAVNILAQSPLFAIVSVIGAIAGLIVIHARMKEVR